MEISNINKVHGINFLMKHWGIEESDVMTFGDSGNGIEMLGRA